MLLPFLFLFLVLQFESLSLLRSCCHCCIEAEKDDDDQICSEFDEDFFVDAGQSCGYEDDEGRVILLKCACCREYVVVQRSEMVKFFLMMMLFQ